MAEWWSGITKWWAGISDTLTLGSIAEWVTAIIALIAAIAAVRALKFSRRANVHAQAAATAAEQSSALTDKAYRDDVRVRDEAQARLVYATLEVGTLVIVEGGEVPAPRQRNGALVQLPGMVSEGVGGPRDSFVTQSAQTVRVAVHNRSTEVISSIRTSLYDVHAKREVETATGRIALLPDETLEVEFLTPHGAQYSPDIAFRDAAGKYWARRGFDPIAPLPEEQRNEFGFAK